ncbi:unnamed protein product [Adineta ricciae]|uniref:A-kinase anchor protein 17A n=1 Tax=Adineta ricciae TaxID=249248 RepID=A0A814F0L0_ADIRI|nr:unnamed protein product [Adineta ricciae]CAF1349488.1 unnamed protein product [Adineta ricciae]
MSNISQSKDLSERVALCEPLRMYLKPIARINITVPIPPSMRVTGAQIPSWEIMDKIRELILPDEFVFLRLLKNTGELFRFEGELESKAIARSCLTRLDNTLIRLETSGNEFRLRAAEAKLPYPTRTEWETFFRETKGMNETKPGERADTIHIEGLPIRWFQAKQNPLQAAQAAAAAIGPSGLPVSSATSNTDDKENKPSIEILQQVFSAFGEIRCCDLPCLDPYRTVNGTLGTNVPVQQVTTFDAYIQYSEYIGFVKAMDACRNMKLMITDETNTAYSANIKVDFDRTRHLSDRMIKKRRIEQMKATELNKLKQADTQRLRDEDERRKEIERLRIELQDAEAEDVAGSKDVTKDNRRRQREEKRRLKRLESKRLHEEKTLAMKIALEERKMLIAHRKLESMRLLEELFNRVKVQIAQEELSKKERELQEQRLRGMDIDTTNLNTPPPFMPTQPSTSTAKEYKSLNTSNNKDMIEAQLNELRKEFYQKDETIDDILRKRTTINERKVF